MNNFYIEKLIISGAGKDPGVIYFHPGLNLIIGPSNSGKSLIIDSIDYMFGYEHKGKKRDKHYRLDGMKTRYGYDHITLHIRTQKGLLVMERSLHDSSILLTSTDPDFASGKYSANHTAKKNISSVLLQLIGVDEPVKILSSVKGKNQSLTWRSFHHMFLIRQSFIARETSPLINPTAEQSTETSGPAALLYLINETDASFIENGVDANKGIKKAAVIDYIEQKLNELEEEKKHLPTEQPEVQALLHHTALKAATHFKKSTDDSNELLKQIQLVEEQLSEQYVMHSQFEALRTQYQADLERMTFLVEGELHSKEFEAPQACPFCGHEIEQPEDPSYLESVRGNLEHIKHHLSELNKADQAVQARIHDLSSQKKSLNERLTSIEPFDSDAAGAEIVENLSQYATQLTAMRTISQIEAEQEAYRKDLMQRQLEKEETQLSYHIQDKYPAEVLTQLESQIINILKKIHFPDAGSAHLNVDTWDIDFGTINKASLNGGGYCGIVNSAFAVGLQEFLNKSGKHSPQMTIIDSALTALSEAESITDAESIKDAFIHYLMETSASGQIIIAEHKDRMPHFIDELCDGFNDYQDNTMQIIQFSHDLSKGRVGLFPGVCDEGK